MKLHLAVFLLAGSGLANLSAAEMPLSAEIVDVPTERRDSGRAIGNVKVKFADGRAEFWTRLGRCMDVQRSDSGLVGWTRYTGRNSYGEPVNSVLRVMVSESRWMDFSANPSVPFIDGWRFVDRDTAVLVRSRGRHGPSIIRKFSLKSGELIGETGGNEEYADTPEWAKPLADAQPR